MNSNPNLTPIDLLSKGSDNAISMERLSGLTGFTTREVRQSILSARLSGFLICSNTNGYFIPETETEIIDWYHTMMLRVKTTLKILKHYESYISDEYKEEPYDRD